MSEFLKKTRRYIRSGPAGFIKKSLQKVFKTDEAKYARSVKKKSPDREDLLRQTKDSEYGPLISVVVPAYRTNPSFFGELIGSVMAQSYENWELVIADGSAYAEDDEKYFELEKIAMEAGDPGRVRYIRLAENLGISGNTNEAIRKSSGDWVVFVDHDDTLTPDALYEVWYAASGNLNAGVVYSDEDKIGKGGRYFDPHFKPELDMELLTNVNYISHLFAIRRDLLEEIGYLNSEFDGAQDYDLVLRACEKAGAVAHVPKVLYHWRVCEGSTSAGLSEKDYAHDAGRRALLAHTQRMGRRAGVGAGKLAGSYIVRERIGDWPEVLVVRTRPNTIPVIKREACKDRVIWFLADGAKEDERLKKAMLSRLLLPGTGVVGAVIRSGASVIDGGYAIGCGATFAGVPAGEPGYMGRLFMSRNVTAASCACMMMTGETYLLLGGADVSAGSDWDRELCIRAGMEEKSVIMLPLTVDAPAFEGRKDHPDRYAGLREKWTRDGRVH
ncbi:MAG: glycosyltransferase [Lachnospiraceae bacterium]|nr:glycosyltransferase [Lachnospiraceae bacterium]